MKASLLSLPFIVLSAHAEGGYTNHAGNVVAGWPVKLTATQVTLAERAAPTARWGYRARPTADHLPTATYPLSIFPESEQRRIAADEVSHHSKKLEHPIEYCSQILIATIVHKSQMSIAEGWVSSCLYWWQWWHL